MANMLGRIPSATPNAESAPRLQSPSQGKPVVIGLYGVSGCGKTYLLQELEKYLGTGDFFTFYEGSQMLDDVVPGGLQLFRRSSDDEKHHWRKVAVNEIKHDCIEKRRAAVVAAHYSFWREGNPHPEIAWTENDGDTYTHVLYLDTPAQTVYNQSLGDSSRRRPAASVAHIQKWQQTEKDELRKSCERHGILFSPITSPRGLGAPPALGQIARLLCDFRQHTEAYNWSVVQGKLDRMLARELSDLSTVLVRDGDKTLAEVDTGLLFWKHLASSGLTPEEKCPFTAVFSGPLGYSYAAFRQVALLYEAIDKAKLETLCEQVAADVDLQPAFLALLKQVARRRHVRAVVVTCGLRRVWEKVLEREGLQGEVEVFGTGRFENGYVVTPAVKGASVDRLRQVHKLRVWAFGDSPLDLEMMKRADHAVVVVGSEATRSKSMDSVLRYAIENEGLRASQILLPANSSPRLETATLPVVRLTDSRFLASVLSHNPRNFLFATDKGAAKLLMTAMRDATASGPVLRDVHRRVGSYLATEYVTDVVGLTSTAP
jgi:phosphoserine phosphatase